MMGKRGRNINTFPTGELCAEIQIRVFVVKKEILVQETVFGGIRPFHDGFTISQILIMNIRPWMQFASSRTN